MLRLHLLFAAALAASVLDASAQTSAATPDGTSQTPPPQKTCVRPRYPAEALRNEWTGESTIAFLIGADGTVKEAKILKSSGHDILDEAAKDALSQCRFKPARKDGQPVASWQPVQYVWAIQ
jgi:TonB family protein